MKLKHLKEKLNKLTDEQLEKNLLYASDEYSISGVVAQFSQAKEDLYYTGEDDPSKLYTKKQLKQMGMDKEEIEECEVEIPKGAFYIKF